MKDVLIDRPAGKLRVRLYRRAELGRTAPALLWFHGGGYVMGWPEQDDRTCLAIASRLPLTVASVEYRLAPENPFPAALDDAHTVLQWMVANSIEHNLDTDRIAIGGGSAGGGLAAALAQRVRDEGQIHLALQMLVYPMLDDETGSHAAPAPRDVRIWTATSNRLGWSSYLGDPADGRRDLPYAVPARRKDLAGLAPAWIGVGTEDLFYDEGADYARRLTAHGVPSQLMAVPGAFHGFDAVLPHTDTSRRFLDEQVAALSTALHLAPATAHGPRHD